MPICQDVIKILLTQDRQVGHPCNERAAYTACITKKKNYIFLQVTETSLPISSQPQLTHNVLLSQTLKVEIGCIPYNT